MEKTIKISYDHFNDFQDALEENEFYENKDYRIEEEFYGADFIFENLSDYQENEVNQIINNIRNKHK